MDLLIIKDAKRIEFEIKYTDVPRITPSMKIALDDLRLDHLYVIFPGKVTFELAPKITACGLDHMFLCNIM